MLVSVSKNSQVMTHCFRRNVSKIVKYNCALRSSQSNFLLIEFCEAGKVSGYQLKMLNFKSVVDANVHIKLTERTVRRIRVAKVFCEYTKKINAIDFSPNGECLISSNEDGQINIYNCNKFTRMNTVNSSKFGVSLIHFANNEHSAIHSSTKVNDVVCYFDLLDNQYIRYFGGHTKKISISISPGENSILSSSLDKTIRLWDLRSRNCRAMLHATGRPIANFDPESLIFAAGINSERIKLFDLRAFDNGPFATFDLNQKREYEWTGLKFSKNGKYILITTAGKIIRMIDAFDGTPLQTFTGKIDIG